LTRESSRSVLAFVAFIVTFLVTRAIVRMIRAGKGPFKKQRVRGGLHIHHVVPGRVILNVSAASSPPAAHGRRAVGVDRRRC
jgi:hypothetical protein